jgi:hypothetical protein
MAVDVIAMKRDVDHAAGRARKQGGEPAGENDAAVGDTEEDGRLGGVASGDGRSQSLDRPLDSFGANAFRWGHEHSL